MRQYLGTVKTKRIATKRYGRHKHTTYIKWHVCVSFFAPCYVVELCTISTAKRSKSNTSIERLVWVWDEIETAEKELLSKCK